MEQEILPILHIPIVNHSPYPSPAYATARAAGMDVYAHLQEPIEIPPLGRRLIPTGLHISLPPGYEAQIRPRSGWALKYGITVLNSPGTIDADYRGEIKVLLANLSADSFRVSPGDRICQMVVARHSIVAWDECESLDPTERGEGGFGHSGSR